MKSFSSLDLYFFIKENKESLMNSRLETFYLNNNMLYLRIYQKGKGNQFFTISLGSYLYLSSTKSNAPFHPTSFVSYMRKYLKNSFIDGIEQIGLERVLKLTLSKKSGEEVYKYHFFIELFSGGNIILCDSDDVILNSLIKKTYKDRIVKNKQAYALPQKKELNPLEIDEKSLKPIVENSEVSIVKFLALECGMGGKYGEEICARADVDKNTLVKDMDVERVFSLIKLPFSLELAPCVVLNNNSITDFFPFIPNNYENIEKKKSFNECLFSYFTQFEEQKDEKNDEYSKKLKKLQNRIKKQEEQKEKVLQDSQTFSEKGEKIYEHYGELEELLEGLTKAAKEKGWDHVFEVIENNQRLKELVDKLDYKNNKIVVNLD